MDSLPSRAPHAASSILAYRVPDRSRAMVGLFGADGKGQCAPARWVHHDVTRASSAAPSREVRQCEELNPGTLSPTLTR